MLFITELVLDLFIFITCAVVCAVLLFRAHDMSQHSNRLTDATYIAQQYAESMRAQVAPQENDDYTVQVDVDYDEDNLKYAVISVYFEDDFIYSLTTALREGWVIYE